MRADFDPAAIAASYEAGGAACLSVLTDREFFQGGPEHLLRSARACGLPVLRKDFIIDPYQVHEARALGADCILLIVAAPRRRRTCRPRALRARARHGGAGRSARRGELERALALQTPLIGINNRDLRTFETRLETTLDLLPRVPPGPHRRHRERHPRAGGRRAHARARRQRLPGRRSLHARRRSRAPRCRTSSPGVLRRSIPAVGV